jgi:hypothetical protein
LQESYDALSARINIGSAAPWPMSEYGEYDNWIDWDEAILAADAAELKQSQVATASADLLKAQAVTGQQEDDELLLLYDILARDDDSFSALPDIEDLGMGMQASSRKTAKTLYEQFRRKRGFLSVTDLSAWTLDA